ncbi:MAG TPA: hypothetical protein VFT27_03735 [Actinomycetota bacterium]|nr:hypothetical protein [Actinomycetota bacterium]
MRPRFAAASMTVLTLVAASCSAQASGQGDGSSATAGDPEIQAYLALCSARDAAAADDLASAEATFEDDAHEALHHLAAEVQSTDRPAAGALLQAKSEVEADFLEEAPDPPTVADHVQALLAAMGTALEVVGLTAPGCPEP